MAWSRSPAQYPQLRKYPEDPRFLELQTQDPAGADLLVCGVPFDGAVIGRKGAAGGPTGIRDALRFFATHDPERDLDLAASRWHDLGDLSDVSGEVLKLHGRFIDALSPHLRSKKPCLMLGGDNSLSFPFLNAMRDIHGGKWGILILDAHYDVRPWSGQPTSGTPYGRMLEELQGHPVKAENMVHVGIRSWANTASLAKRAKGLGLQPFTMADIDEDGIEAIAEEALERATDGVDHLMLSVDLDVLDQSVASGVSAPGIGGMGLGQAAEVVFRAARHPLLRGMDLVECAPSLDATGNTSRSAARLVVECLAGITARRR